MVQPLPLPPIPGPPEPGWSPIVITPREIYDAIVRVSAKVDLLTLQVTEAEHDKADHENRLRSLERGRWPFPSVAVLVSLGSLAVAIFLH
jgi:hypothetical protein